MINNYKILFKVSVLHHYLLNVGGQDYEGMNASDKAKQISKYRVSDIFEIEPTESTRRRANGSRLLFKITPDGFIVATATESADINKPLVDFTAREKFSFNLYIKDASLFNFSALPIKDNQGAIYNFNNLNKSNFQSPNLANIPTAFDSTLASELASDGDPDTFAYKSGDLVVDNVSDPTTLYEATRSTNANTSTITDWRPDQPADTYDNATTYLEGDTVVFTVGGKDGLYVALEDVTGVTPTDPRWDKIADLPLYYANEQDRIPLYGPLLDYTFELPNQDLTFEISDPFGNIIKTLTAQSTADQMTYQLDLRTLRTGRFNLVITDNLAPATLQDYDFYLLREPVNKPLFGTIDIYSGDDLGTYSLVDNANNFQSPEFLLRLKNRSTIWRYIDSKNRQVLHESDFNPLTYSGIVNVAFDGSNLPNPDIQIIKPEPAQYYSDIYL